MEITFSIVGTSGRKNDALRLSRNHYDAMYLIAEKLIVQLKENGYPITHAVSGGAAYADHIAVRLFLNKKVNNLRLYIPCEFKNGRYIDTHIKDYKRNPGGTLNYYHKQFQTTTNVNSLSEIQIASSRGAELIVIPGFFNRNIEVSKSDIILAMTFGKDNFVKDGGTAHTVKCYLDRVKSLKFFDKSFHYDLNKGELFLGCQISSKIDDESENYSIPKSNSLTTSYSKI